MSTYLEEAKRLRAITEIHYNCAQSVLLPFVKAKGLPEKEFYDLAVHFGGGMKMGSVCGAVTGALMALGLYGIDDPKEANAFCRKFKEAHDGFLDCRDLLRISAERGEVKKAHCDALVYECVELVEKMIENKE